MLTNRQELLQRLETVTPGLAPAREVEAQSSCFIIKNGTAFAYNGVVACRTKVNLNGITGAVAAEPLLGILGKLAEDEIDVSQDDGHLVIQGSGKRRVGVRMEAEIHLPVDEVEHPKQWIDLPEDFTEAVAIVQQCASTDDSAFNLSCVHIHPDFVEACDNYQLTRYPIATGIERPTLIPQKAIKNIANLDMTKQALTDSWMHFRNSQLVISCRRYIERYPDLSKQVSQRGKKAVLPGGLFEAVEKAEIFSRANAEENKILISLENQRVRIRGEGNAGWYEEVKRLKYDGPPLKFFMAPRVLSEIAKRHNECELSKKYLRVDVGRFTYIACLVLSED